MDKNTVRKIARLARLHLPADAEDRAIQELSNAMKWIDQLQAVNTDGIEPLASIMDITLPLRADSVTDGNCVDKILANAPEALEGFFVVPKIVE